MAADKVIEMFSHLQASDQKVVLRRLQRIVNPTLVDETFWVQEAGGALLSRNFGCFAPDTMEGLQARARSWLDMLPVNVQVNPADSAKCTDEAALRIFQRDADRTFDVVWRKDEFIDALKLCWIVVKDYQQGLGYILAFLFMLMDKVSCVRIALALHHSPNHSNGYFAAQPDNFVRDARVMHRLLVVLFPDVAEHFKNNGLVLENCNMYCVKWFSGLGLHFLTYSDMFRYYELYIQHGIQFTVRFTLAYIEALRGDLLKAVGTNELSMLLRNETQDHKKPHQAITAKGKDFFNNVMDRAMVIDLQGRDILSMRATEGNTLQQELVVKREKMAQMAEESDGIEFSDED